MITTDRTFHADTDGFDVRCDSPVLVVYPTWEAPSVALPVAECRKSEGYDALWLTGWIALIAAFAVRALGA